MNEPQLKWIHTSRQRKEMLDPRIEASKTLPTQMSRLTGDRVTYRCTVRDRLSPSRIGISEPWQTPGSVARKNGKAEWSSTCTQKQQQLRHVKRTEPRHCNARVGKPEPKTALHAPNYVRATTQKGRANWLTFVVITNLTTVYAQNHEPD